MIAADAAGSRSAAGAVLIDFYGTIAYVPAEDYIETKARMARVVGCDPQMFLSTWRSLTTPSAIGSLASETARVSTALAMMGRCASARDLRVMAEMEAALQYDGVRLMPDAMESLHRLRDLDLKIVLVTNCSVAGRRAIDKLGLRSLFDSLILSCEVRLVKPDPRIYALASASVGVPERNCLFAGDGDCGELDGARSVGMTAIRIGGSEYLTLHQDGSRTHDFAIESIRQLPALVQQLLPRENREE
jgi:putative hydrolase of the HAD superfamily